MKYQGLTKFFYQNQFFKNCSHLKFAIDQKMLDIRECLDDNTFFMPQQEIIEIFGNNQEEVSSIIKHFSNVKNKVKNYFEKNNQEKLKGFSRNFQIYYQGLFASFDFLKINNKNKEIFFYIVKPIISKDNITQKALKKALLEFGHLSCFEDQKFYNINLLVDSKNKVGYELQYYLTILILKYPHYKITCYLPLIIKDFPPHQFKIFSHLHDPQNSISRKNSTMWLNKLEEINQKLKTPQSFSLPLWQPSFLFNQRSCFICSIDKKKQKIYQNFNFLKVKHLVDNKFNGKLAMFDFETICDPLPNVSYYKPYDHIVVQVSIHKLNHGQIVDHQEYLCQDMSKSELNKIYEMLLTTCKQGYKLVAYYQNFESACIRQMEKVLNRHEISQKFHNLEPKSSKIQNLRTKHSSFLERIYDLYDFFKKISLSKKALISLKKFGFSSSIKKTIEFCCIENFYQNLEINNGFKASMELQNLLNIKNQNHYQKLKSELLKYCKQDTLSMVYIYQQIIKILKLMENTSAKTKQEILNNLEYG